MATKVLFVEDDADVRMVIGEGLRYLGMEVATAESAEKALLKLKFDKPDIILLDMNLPGISGWELAEKLRQGIYRDVPICAFSGASQIGDEQKALAAGCAAFIAKPCEPTDIKRKIEDVLTKKKKL